MITWNKQNSVKKIQPNLQSPVGYSFTHSLLALAILFGLSSWLHCGRNDNHKNTKPPLTSGNTKAKNPKPMTNKLPSPATHFENAHSLTPTSNLIAWFKKNAEQGGKRSRFKLPVVIVLSDKLPRSVDRAFIGTSPEDASSSHDRVLLELDDGGLSIGLMARLGQICGQEANVCALWLEGYWGPLVIGPPMPPPPGADPNAHAFAVLAIGELITEENSALQVQIAK